MTFKEIKNLIYDSCELVVDDNRYLFVRDIFDFNDFDDYEVIGIRSKYVIYDTSYVVISLKKGD